MKFIKIIGILLYAMLVISCSKNVKDTASQSIIDCDVSVTINVLGVENTDDVVLKEGSTQVSSKSNVITTKEVKLDNGMEAIVSVSESAITSQGGEDSKSYFDTTAINKNNIALKNKLRSSTKPLGSNKSYVVVFRKEDNTFIEAVIANSNTPAIFSKANYNTKYKWFAYSFNDNSVLSYNEANPTIDVTWDKGLLYDSGVFQTSNSEATNSLNIVFKRKSTIIEYIVDNRGVFDTPSELIISPIGTGNTESKHAEHIKGGTFNLKDGSYITTNIDQSPSVTTLSSFRSTYSGNDPIRIVSFNTVSTAKIDRMAIRFTKMLYNTDLGPASTYRNTNKSNFKWEWSSSGTLNGQVQPGYREFILNNLNITPQLGKKYRMVITLTAPKINTTHEGRVTTWALGNLYYDNSKIDDGISNGKVVYGERYRFKHHNSNFYGDSESAPETRLYWLWNYLTPNGKVNNVNNSSTVLDAANGDPCMKVFPYKYWKMPNSQNLEDLANTTSYAPNDNTVIPRKYSQHDNTTGSRLRYIEFTYVNNSLKENHQWPYNWRLALVIPQLGFFRDNSYVNLMLNGSNSATNNAYAYLWGQSDREYLQLLSGTTNSKDVTGTVNVSINTATRMTIRCVKNTSTDEQTKYDYSANLPTE